MTFRHRHQFEFSAGQNFDGGVLEVSQDGGATFVDAATLGTVPYTGTIATGSGNPLGGRQGFVRATAGFPAFTTATVSFGTALANRTILVRFRIGTDEAVGDLGWTIDDISFTGITNKPFRSVVNDIAVCLPPIANAGPDQSVAASSLVTLDGSASSDPNNDPLTFTWTQLQGPAVPVVDDRGQTGRSPRRAWRRRCSSGCACPIFRDRGRHRDDHGRRRDAAGCRPRPTPPSPMPPSMRVS
jgi:hypothetical protein